MTQDNADVPVRADRLKAGERFQVAGIEYQIVSVDLNRSNPWATVVRLTAVRPDGTSSLELKLLDDDWLILTHKIPSEW